MIEIWAENTTVNDVLMPLVRDYGLNVVTARRAAIGRLSFTFAKTLSHIPYEYTVRDEVADPADFDLVATAIRAWGQWGRLERHRYRYLEPGDGWKCWRIARYPLINRARADND